MKGKLIVIEASDGSGKATQAKLLYDRLAVENFKVKKVEFPDYQSDSSALIKMYLRGEFGTNPNDVSPYVASTFYTVDRYASYKKEWESFYLSGGIVIADRYVTSNMVHQAAKITNIEERKDFLNWLWDLEFIKFKLPVPDCVIFLDMPPQYSQELIKDRLNKAGNQEKDIHERNLDYLLHSYNNACRLRSDYGWQMVNCVQDDKLRSIEEIHDDIYHYTLEIIDKNSESET